MLWPFRAKYLRCWCWVTPCPGGPCSGRGDSFRRSSQGCSRGGSGDPEVQTGQHHDRPAARRSVELAHLHRAEPGFDRQLRRKISRRETDRLDVCRGECQQSRRKPDGQEAEDALVRTRGKPAPSGSRRPRQWRSCGTSHLPAAHSTKADHHFAFRAGTALSTCCMTPGS